MGRVSLLLCYLAQLTNNDRFVTNVCLDALVHNLKLLKHFVFLLGTSINVPHGWAGHLSLSPRSPADKGTRLGTVTRWCLLTVWGNETSRVLGVWRRDVNTKTQVTAIHVAQSTGR